MATISVKQGTLSDNSGTRVSPTSVLILTSIPPFLYSLHSLQKQGWASKSPGCFDGGEELHIIWALSHTQLLPKLSQLKVKGYKSVTEFFDLVFLTAAWGAPQTGPWSIFNFYHFHFNVVFNGFHADTLKQHTLNKTWLHFSYHINKGLGYDNKTP